MMVKGSILLLVTITLFSITTSWAQKPSPPLASPPITTQQPQGMNTVPLVPASPVGAPISAAIDIVQILTKAKRFSVLIRLLKTTQLINQLNSQLIASSSSGVTLFAPEDSAFSNLKPGFLNSLNDRQKVELLQFHTLSSFVSISNFDTLTNPVQTQAGDDSQRLQLNVTTYGGNRVGMATGAVNATVTGTVYTDNKLAIYEVSKVLVPLDFVLPKAKAPSPAKGVSPGAGESGKNGSGDDVVPVNAGSVSLKVEKVTWMPLVLVLALRVMV